MPEQIGHPSISKREFRKLSSLPRSVLDYLIYQYGTLEGRSNSELKSLFKEIESTGKLPDGRPLLSLAKTGLGEVSELPTDVQVSRQIQQEIQSLPQDINKLSPEEISQKAGLIEELGQKGRFFDRESILGGVRDRLRANGLDTNEDITDAFAQRLTDVIAGSETYPSSNRIKEIAGEISKNFPNRQSLLQRNALQKFAGDSATKDLFLRGIKAGEFTRDVPLSPEQAESLGELKSRLRAIQEQQAKEASISQFIETELPERGEKAVSELEQALQKSQQQFFTGEITPATIQQLSARGVLRGGDLASALAEQAGKLQTGIQQTVAPLRFETKQAPTRLKYENLLRQALESGQNLNEAVNFTRNLYQQDLQRQFQAGQSELERKSREGINRENFALQLALMSQQPSRPDPFLTYGLPFLGQVLGSSGSSILGQGISKLGSFLKPKSTA